MLGYRFFLFVINSPLTKLECISNEQGMFTLENPYRYPKGQGPNPNPRGAQPQGIWIGIALGPRDEVWIFQGEHSLLIGYTFQFS